MSPIYVTTTPSKFKLQFAYNKEMVAVIHKIPSNPRWDGADRMWIVEKESLNYPLGRDAKWYIDAFTAWAVQKGYCSARIDRELEVEQDWTIPEMQEFLGEHYMKLEPYQYQLEGVRYALDHKHCIFGDQPGLGKTLQAICSVVKAHNEKGIYGDSFPVLVVCPASLKVNWQREFKKFAGLDAVILDDKNRMTWEQYYYMTKQNGESICNVFITNYESLKKFFVKKIKSDQKRINIRSIELDERAALFKTIIIDESHKCKASNTQQSKFVESIARGKRYIFELTGTPVVNNNTDLIQQLKILGMLDAFGGYSNFIRRFCDGPKQSSNMKELNFRLWNQCFFRREKQKVLTQLPEKTRQYITCEITNRKEYNDAERDLIKYLREYKDADDEKVERAMRGEVMVKIGVLKAIAARGKIKEVSSFIHDIIDGEDGEKLILFAYLREVITELKKEFPNAVTVTGSDNIAQKQYAVDSFQNDPDRKLIILNYKSGGTGLTLTAASRVAFIEFPWTYSDCEQAEDRAHRNGQKNNVNCYYFLGEKTIDKYMYDVIQTKREIACSVTGTDEQIEEDMINLTMDMFKDQLK